ncbi:hypothetical protein J7L29_07960 [Candidatus Bathyarchaeota archaeon]|nr:hypothetical protein [Candidatus Bathyarchaeota archaeon]
MYGWVGKVGRIDLTREKATTEDTSKYAPEKFIGGRGLCAKIFWDNVDKETHLKLMDNPYAPENLMVIAVGPLTGTLAPTSGRAEIGSVAPQAYPKPAYTRSGLGGHWPSELKYAGFDAIYIFGKAEEPVYIFIEDGKIEIRDARKLWGLDTFETQRALYRELGQVRVLTIGPAGERFVRISTIQSDTGSAFGQGGFGAVMGSKNLKAIAVRGTGGVKVADPDRLMELVRYASRLLYSPEHRWWPKPYFGKYYSPKPKEVLDSLDEARVRWDACDSCPIGCRYYLDIPGSVRGQVQCVDFALIFVGYPATRESMKPTELGNKLGVNFFQLFVMLSCLQTAAEKGYLTDENTGLPFSKGVYSPEFVSAMFEAIAYKRGFGAVLAEGMPRLAYYIAEKYNDPSFIEIGKMSGHRGFATHWSQHFPVNALLWALDSRDPFDDFHEYTYWYSMKAVYMTEEEKKVAAKKAYGSEKAIDYLSWDYKAKTAKILIERACIKSSLPLCDWAFPIITSPYTKDHSGDTSLESKFYSAVTGIETSEEEMYVIGERIFNLERAIMVREGRRREQDYLPYEFTKPKDEVIWPGSYEDGPKTLKGVYVDPDYFNTKLLDEFYEVAGWTKEGIPTRAKLEELGLKDVADSLGLP